jgi:hypothetical protein
MRLIPEIREAWRYSSVRWGIVMSAVGGYWSSLDKAEQVDMLSALHLAPGNIPLVMGLVGVLLRITTFRKDGQ